jgi:hypothetical protein
MLSVKSGLIRGRSVCEWAAKGKLRNIIATSSVLAGRKALESFIID